VAPLPWTLDWLQALSPNFLPEPERYLNILAAATAIVTARGHPFPAANPQNHATLRAGFADARQGETQIPVA